MKWSPQQAEALQKVSAWRARRPSPFFLLAGYAGTGKSTLAKHFAEGLGRVEYACYTGKAAHVLRKHGITNARTIHNLIYTPRDKCDDRLRELRLRLQDLDSKKDPTPYEIGAMQDLERSIELETKNLRRPDFFLNGESDLIGADLLIIDEYSMVDEQTGRDLLSFGTPILALGDPGQLPPVQGRRFFAGQPDVMLTEIHRQAAENPIIRMSAEVRKGRNLALGTYGDSLVVRRRDLSPEQLAEHVNGAEQVLVGTNATRRRYNEGMRQMRGYGDPLPMKGEKLVCLRNNHQLGLLNGQIWSVLGSATKDNYVRLHLQDEDGTRVTCLAHPDHFRGTEIDVARVRAANELDFGYALTVHKAQGSQWDHVALVDEWTFKDREKWLYTGITRAAERVTVLT